VRYQRLTPKPCPQSAVAAEDRHTQEAVSAQVQPESDCDTDFLMGDAGNAGREKASAGAWRATKKTAATSSRKTGPSCASWSATTASTLEQNCCCSTRSSFWNQNWPTTSTRSKKAAPKTKTPATASTMRASSDESTGTGGDDTDTTASDAGDRSDAGLQPAPSRSSSDTCSPTRPPTPMTSGPTATSPQRHRTALSYRVTLQPAA
jgi:hypothetical protein